MRDKQVIRMVNAEIDIFFLQSYFEECMRSECQDDQSNQLLPVFKVSNSQIQDGTRVKFIFKLDGHKKCRERYFNNIQGLKIADCVIVVKHNNELYSFIIELKLSKRGMTHAVKQIEDTYMQLKKLEQMYHDTKIEKKREIAMLRDFLYLEKTTSIFMANLAEYRKKRGKNQDPPGAIITSKHLQEKNLKEVVSFILDKMN